MSILRWKDIRITGRLCTGMCWEFMIFSERITSRFPDLFVEGCSGGGGRFDAGMLYYTPQIWCSDNTDAVERLQMQKGTSYGYPISAVGSHVSLSCRIIRQDVLPT